MYQRFSEVYDQMMEEIPYDEWFERLHHYMISCGKESGHLCELGCGTGQMTGRFADVGYDVTGIDLSPDMLSIAMQKKKEEQNILYLNQNMSDFSLHKRADVILCICDSLNYLLSEEELLSTFQCVRRYLVEGGLFVFDVKTEFCFQEIMGDLTRVEDDGDNTIIWDNLYDSDEKINEYLITIFQKDESDENYRRYDECHVQRAYTLEQIKELLNESGLKLVDCYGADMDGPLTQKDERWYFTAVSLERDEK